MAGRLSTIGSWRLKMPMSIKEIAKMALTYGKPPSVLGSIDHLDDVFKYMQQTRNFPTRQNIQAAQQNYNDIQAMNQAQANMGQGVPSLDYVALDLLKRRMAGITGTFKLNQDEFLTCYVTNSTVYVFFVLNGKAGHFTEEVTIFPSDKILTQIRMIR